MLMPVHMVLIRDMGMSLGEIFDLEALADDCAADGEWEFFFTAPVLKVITGGRLPHQPARDQVGDAAVSPLPPPSFDDETRDPPAHRDVHRRARDRRQPTLTASVFTDDGVLQIYSGDPNEGGTLDRERMGRAEIETAMGGLARYRVTSHGLAQSTIDVHGSEAESETYCVAHHLTDHEDGSVSDRVMFIRYLDDWIRTVRRLAPRPPPPRRRLDRHPLGRPPLRLTRRCVAGIGYGGCERRRFARGRSPGRAPRCRAGPSRWAGHRCGATRLRRGGRT